MRLEEKLQKVFSDLEINPTCGRIELRSDALNEFYTTLSEPTTFLGKIAHTLKQKLYLDLKKPRIQKILAKGMEAYLAERAETCEHAIERDSYECLLEAFQDYHTLKINNLEVSYNHLSMPNILIRNLYWIAYFSFVAANEEIPALNLPGYVVVPASIPFLLYASTKQELPPQSVDFPIPDLDELCQDIVTLTEKYIQAKNTKIPNPAYVLKYIEEGGLGLKSMADTYLQKYCPSLNLKEIKLEIKELSQGTGGGVGHKTKTVKIDKGTLQRDVSDFFEIYPHEVGHIDGINSEGRATYLATRTLLEMDKDNPHSGFGLKAYTTLLIGAVHAYIIERKKEMREGKHSRLIHLREVISYNRKLRKSDKSGEEVRISDIGDNPQIYYELEKLKVPSDILDVVFETYENLSWKKQIFFLAQRVLKGDEFMGGYTKDLYELTKHKGGFW